MTKHGGMRCKNRREFGVTGERFAPGNGGKYKYQPHLQAKQLDTRKSKQPLCEGPGEDAVAVANSPISVKQAVKEER